MTAPRAYVITPETMYSDSGGSWPTPAGLLHDLPRVLSGVAAMFRGEGVVVLSGIAVRDLQHGAAAADWKRGRLEGWTTFRPRHDETLPEIHLCVLQETTQDLFGPDTAPEVIAQRLGRIHALTGVSYRMTPGVTGCAVMRSLHTDRRKKRQPQWITDPLSVPARMAGPLHWTRDPDLVEIAAGGRAVKLDVRACYPTAAGVAPLAWEPLEHTPDATYTRGLAGYWLIRPPLLHGGEGPQPCDRRKALIRNGQRIGVWVTTPVMDLYDECGIHPDVVDAWTAPAVQVDGTPVPGATPSPRILRSWSEKLAHARARVADEQLLVLDQPDAFDEWDLIGGVVKHIGNDGMGQASKAGGRVCRKDWYDTDIDQARVNMLRKIYARYKTDGVWPLRATGVDSCWYHTDNPDRIGMEPWMGDTPGKLRAVNDIPLARYIELHHAHKAVMA